MWTGRHWQGPYRAAAAALRELCCTRYLGPGRFCQLGSGSGDRAFGAESRLRAPWWRLGWRSALKIGTGRRLRPDVPAPPPDTELFPYWMLSQIRWVCFEILRQPEQAHFYHCCHATSNVRVLCCPIFLGHSGLSTRPPAEKLQSAAGESLNTCVGPCGRSGFNVRELMQRRYVTS